MFRRSEAGFRGRNPHRAEGPLHRRPCLSPRRLTQDHRNTVSKRRCLQSHRSRGNACRPASPQISPRRLYRPKHPSLRRCPRPHRHHLPQPSQATHFRRRRRRPINSRRPLLATHRACASTRSACGSASATPSSGTASVSQKATRAVTTRQGRRQRQQRRQRRPHPHATGTAATHPSASVMRSSLASRHSSMPIAANLVRAKQPCSPKRGHLDPPVIQSLVVPIYIALTRP